MEWDEEKIFILDIYSLFIKNIHIKATFSETSE